MTLAENIRISQSGNSDDIIAALDKAGVEWTDAEAFPGGVDTMLSREFDGVDLSGGYWQRVAIARGLFRRHEIIVLDEPTAAIDPIEESKIYRQFAEMVKGKTSVIVTHRLGSARIANRIAVMDAGKIVDIGTHDELMLRRGLYADMYAAQAEWY